VASAGSDCLRRDIYYVDVHSVESLKNYKNRRGGNYCVRVDETYRYMPLFCKVCPKSRIFDMKDFLLRLALWFMTTFTFRRTSVSGELKKLAGEGKQGEAFEKARSMRRLMKNRK